MPAAAPFPARTPLMPTHAPLRFWFRCLVVVLLLAMAGGALAGKKRSVLEKNQYAYSAAIRWGDFEGAWSMVDPKVRKDKPMTDADFSRFEQIQVTSYRDLASMSRPDGAVLREVQIEILNRNNLTQRRVRYTEVWRYDAESKNWWIEALPDFWHGR